MYLFALVAGLLTLYFAAVAISRPRPAAILAVILWAAYSIYEFYVANGTLCGTDCNIRVDLILAWPLLAIATLYACNTPGERTVLRKILGVAALVILVLLVAPLVYVALMGFPAVTQSNPNWQPMPK